MSFFLQAFAVVVGEEGGYVNDPADPGGETRYGISKRAYPDVDIKNLTLAQAQAIYQRDYWDALACDGYSWEVALVTFDCGVNQGVSVAKLLHASTQNAREYQAERALRYARSPNFDRFGRGWMRRLFNVFKAAQGTPK
jgi:lysozyme family protein